MSQQRLKVVLEVVGGGTADNAKRPMALGEEGHHAKRSTVTIQSVLKDKLETSVKSCRQRTQSVVEDSCARQAGDKCEIMRTYALRASRVDWETSGRQA